MTSRFFQAVLRAVEEGRLPRARKWAWRRLYNMLSYFMRDADWRFMNYGFVDAKAPFTLDAADEPERPFIGLYQQAVDGLDLAGKRVLEVGSGRGGGSRYIARYNRPAAMTGLDYSPETVKLARRLNADTEGLEFQVGDAEKLPFADNSFDVVVNIESSHCYSNVEAFLKEVNRVLVPGGIFTFADMRAPSMLPALDRQFAASGLEPISERNISREVVAALDSAEARKREVLGRVRILRRFMSEFAGSKGSLLYRGLKGHDVVYLARRYRKPTSH